MVRMQENEASQLAYRPKLLKGSSYGFLSLFSIYLMYILGSADSRIYTDPILVGSTYQPFLMAFFLLIAIVFINRKHPVILAYLTGILMVGYIGMALIVISNVSLVIFPVVSVILLYLMYGSLSDGFVHGMRRTGIFVFATFAMFLIGGAVRFYSNPNEFTLLVGSIYDDENPIGVPFLFYNGIIFYGQYLVVTVSLPIIVLFSALASVLTENYLLIFSLSRSPGSSSLGNLSRTANSALTVLSCQCEGITAAFPSIVATLLLSAVIPLISLSILLVALTNVFLAQYFLRGRRVAFLEKVWRFPSSPRFIYLIVTLIILIPVLTIYTVYFGFEKDLTVLAFLNISMFLYGIMVIYGFWTFINKALSLKKTLIYSLIVISTVLMFLWYYPPLTAFAAFYYSGFILMSVTSIAGGIIAGIVFKSLKERAGRLYSQFITMMFSTLAIVVFYITAIALDVIYRPFGSAEQLLFSLLVWGVTLPFVWISTNISLNYEVPEDIHNIDSRKTGTYDSEARA